VRTSRSRGTSITNREQSKADLAVVDDVVGAHLPAELDRFGSRGRRNRPQTAELRERSRMISTPRTDQ
jgi:hypothetical protein